MAEVKEAPAKMGATEDVCQNLRCRLDNDEHAFDACAVLIEGVVLVRNQYRRMNVAFTLKEANRALTAHGATGNGWVKINSIEAENMLIGYGTLTKFVRAVGAS